MDYFKAFENIKSSLEKSEISLKDEHLAIQVILTDEECGGILYIENYFKKLNVMPYDYYDNNVNVIADYKSFMELISAKKNLSALLEKITIKGDFEAAKDFFDSIKPAKKAPAKKTAAKKAPAKKAEVKETVEKKTTAKAVVKETAEKKAPAKKTTKKASAPKTETKKAEPAKTDAPAEATIVEPVKTDAPAVKKADEKKTTKK